MRTQNSHDRRRADGRKSGWRDEAAPIALLIVVAALLRLALFPGLRGHDDWVYLFYVRSFANGQTDELLGSLWGLRFLIWMPIHLWFEVIGVSLRGAFAPGFLLGLATIPILWCSIRRLGFDRRVAFLGGIFLVFNPIDWMVAGTVRGDIEMSFYGGLILLFLIGMRTTEGRGKWWWGLWAGLAWGLSVLTKEWGYVFAWGFFAVAATEWAGRRRVPWPYLAVAAGFIAVWAIDAAILHHLTGDWLRRVNASMQWYQRAADDGGYLNDPSISYRYLPELLLGLKTERTAIEGFSPNHYPYFGPYMWLLAPALAIASWRKGAARLVALFVAGLLLWVEFGSMSWRQYLPYHKEPRYFAMISVPAAVLMAVAAARVLESGVRRVWRVAAGAAVAGVLTVTGAVAWNNHREYRAGRDFLPALQAWLAERPTTRMWLESSMQQEMDLRFGYRFADPVHGHVGATGWGALQDVEFWSRHEPGDMLLVDRPWREFAQSYPGLNRARFRHVAFIRGERDVAEILRHVPATHAESGYLLSDEDPIKVRRTYSSPGWGRSFDHSLLVLDGRRVTHGIGVHSRTELTFASDPRFPVFSAGVALLDSGAMGSVSFSVLADGEVRYVSPIMREHGRIERVRLDLGGAREITLIVDDAGDGESFDHGVWIEPRMSPAPAPDEVPVAAEPAS